MEKITYTVKFYSEWHCGSGLAAGADLDLLTIKDKNNLPFIPGKTIKGLIREQAEIIQSNFEAVSISKIFGDENIKGECFFSNAELSAKVQSQIISESLTPMLYRKIISTALTSEGVAEVHSLRSMQSVVPCELRGYIENVPSDSKNLVINALKMIKRLGQNRNRGLGRCDIRIVEIANK